MSTERWQQVNHLFHQALKVQPELRIEWVESTCSETPELRAELIALLSAHEKSDSFFDTPVLQSAVQLIAQDFDSLPVGQQFNSYRILSLIGTGGMGEVWMAEDTRLDRKVALKFLPTIYTNDSNRLARFRLEAKADAAMNHPNIATIYSIEESSDHHFIAMEYIDGKPLSDPLFKQNCDHNLFYTWFVPLADALAHAHEHGVIHRDIKPGNIMITASGKPMLLDFGLAKFSQQHGDTTTQQPGAEHSSLHTASPNPSDASLLTIPSTMMGTPAYMSPEQARGEAVGSAADVFSFGVICYEYLCGQHPFAGNTAADLKQNIINREPLPPSHFKPDIPDALEAMILQMLNKDARQRPDAAGVKHILAQLAEQHRQENNITKSDTRNSKKTQEATLNRKPNFHYLFGPFRLDLAERLLWCNSHAITLQPKDFDMLLLLLNQAGRLLTKDKLMQALWPDTHVEEANLALRISNLRKILQEEGGRKYIETVPKVGYRFVVPVEKIEAELLSSEPSQASMQPASENIAYTETEASELAAPLQKHPTQNADWKFLTRPKIITLAILLILLSSIVAIYFLNRTPVLTDKDTILIADFENKTGDAVFDDTLKQAVAVHLAQSPFLNIFPDERERETLRLMNRSPDERVNFSTGREISQRQGLKALLNGSIAKMGENYVISLEAVNSKSGEVFAREQIEVKEKEDVLQNLGEMADSMREKLGESLNSIQRFDVPLEQVTTSSLEALKAFSVGSDQNAKGKYTEAIVSLKHSVELDPQFARAYSLLSRVYSNQRQLGLATEMAQKAFDLRERVTEREKLHIAAQYYSSVTGDLHKEIETMELLKQIYPNDVVARRNLGSRYNTLGQYEKAVVELREAIRLNPEYGSPYRNLANIYLRLSRIDEARAWADQVVERGYDSLNSRARLFEIAFIQSDTAAMQQQNEWAKARQEEYAYWQWIGDAAWFAGKWQKSQEYHNRAYELVRQRNMLVEAKYILINNAEHAANLGLCRDSLANLARAATVPSNLRFYLLEALALARCGTIAQAQKLTQEAIRQYPQNTEINDIHMPLVRAAIELQRNNPKQVMHILQANSQYEGLSSYYRNHLRGQAWLVERNGLEAAKEYQKIIDNRGWAPLSPLYPLAHLGLARAAVLQGDLEKARKSYQDFFTIWKDADPDIPVLIEAKKEYEKLK